MQNEAIFEQALKNGYYFDRAIDLHLYDSSRKLIAAIKTPKTGIKPSITVKGTMIEGSYAVNSYISIQNMAYDINVNDVAYIKCRMYYNGITGANGSNEELDKMKNGNVIIFSVLYADQEKEPPNRAVRFQCTVAAQDYTRYSMLGKVSNGGAIAYTKKPSKKKNSTGEGEQKSNAKWIVDVIQNWATAYNDGLPADSSGKMLPLYSELRISAINYDEEFDNKEYKLSLPNGDFKLGSILKTINSQSFGGTSCPWNVYTSMGVIYINRVAPQNWKDVAEKAGMTKEDELNDFYNTNYLGGKRKIRYVSNSSTVDDERKPVGLYYVKGAYRNEVVIHASTIFDGRIYPGCLCAIQGNAIMGRQGGKNSRITQATDKTIVFRATGAIEYEFSTTENSNMSIKGPRLYEDYDMMGNKPK